MYGHPCILESVRSVSTISYKNQLVKLNPELKNSLMEIPKRKTKKSEPVEAGSWLHVQKTKPTAVKREIIISEDEAEVSLQHYFHNKEYSDINVVGIKGQLIPCHKVVLCKLPFFHAILHNPGSDYNKETNTLSVKMNQTILEIVIGYLYDVPQPFIGIKLNGSTIVDLFDEIVPLRYHAILQDIWNSIVKHVDWKTVDDDRMIDMYTRAATHKLSMQIHPRFNYNVVSKLDCMTIKHLLEQELIPVQSRWPHKYRLETARLMLAGFWCISHKSEAEKKEVIDVINRVVTLPPNPILTIINEKIIKFGWCDVWMKFLTVIMHGGAESLEVLRNTSYDLDEQAANDAPYRYEPDVALGSRRVFTGLTGADDNFNDNLQFDEYGRPIDPVGSRYDN